MNEIDQLSDFLQKLTPLSRSCLLSELERLELCGIDMPGAADLQSRLRAEFRKDGSSEQSVVGLTILPTHRQRRFAPTAHTDDAIAVG